MIGRRLWKFWDRRQAAVDATFDEIFRGPKLAQFRKMNESELYRALITEPPGSLSHAMIAAELRRHEAWRAPAGRAIYIAVAALGTSLAAVMISILHN